MSNVEFDGSTTDGWNWGEQVLMSKKIFAELQKHNLGERWVRTLFQTLNRDIIQKEKDGNLSGAAAAARSCLRLYLDFIKHVEGITVSHDMSEVDKVLAKMTPKEAVKDALRVTNQL